MATPRRQRAFRLGLGGLVSVALAALAWALLGTGGDDGTVQVTSFPASQASGSEGAPGGLVGSSAEPTRGSRDDATRTGSDEAVAAFHAVRVPAWAPAPRAGGRQRILGRVLDDAGHPVSGAVVEARSGLSDGDSSLASSTITDGHGRFALDGAAARGPALVVIRSVGHGLVARLVRPARDALAPADSGDWILRPARRLVGRLRGADGGPPSGRWQVRVRVQVRDHPPGFLVDVPVDLTTGRFEWRACPRGRFVLTPVDPLGLTQTGRAVTVEVGAAPPGEVVMWVEESSAVLALRPSEELPLGRPPVPGSLRLLDRDGEVVEPLDGASLQRYEDLGRGPYTAVLDDPRYLPWRLEGLTAADGRVDVPLRGASALRLEVTDLAGRPIDTGVTVRIATSVEVLMWDAPLLVHPHEVLPRDNHLPVPALGSLHLLVQAQGCKEQMVEVSSLAAGERRRVRVNLPRHPSVSGRVVYTDGTAASDVELRLVRLGGIGRAQVIRVGDTSYHTDSEQGVEALGIGPPSPRGRSIGRTLDTGHFLVEGVRPGRYQIQAVRSGIGYPSPPLVVSKEVEEVHLVLPELAAWSAELSADADVPWERFALAVGSLRDSPASAAYGIGSLRLAHLDEFCAILPLDAEGRARAEGLRPGTYDVWLVRWTGREMRGRGRRLGSTRVTAGGEGRFGSELGPLTPRRVRVRVTGASGPLEGARVRLGAMQDGEQVDLALGTTNALGVADLGHLPGGLWSLTVRRGVKDRWVIPGGVLVDERIEDLVEVQLP